MIINDEEDIERLQADGKITPDDADEIRRFAGFLAEVPPVEVRKTPEGRSEIRRVYLKHYPEYADGE